MKTDSPQIRAFLKFAEPAFFNAKSPVLWGRVEEDEHGRLVVSGTSIPLLYVGRWLASMPSNATGYDLQQVTEQTKELEALVEKLEPKTDISFRFNYKKGKE